MSLPEFKRLLREDFKDVDGEWIEDLIYPLNLFNEQVFSTLNGNLQVGENVFGQIVPVTFTTSPNYIAKKDFKPIAIPWERRQRPRCVLIGQIANISTDAPITNPTSIDWRMAGPNQILIRFIVGLRNRTRYSCNFLIL